MLSHACARCGKVLDDASRSYSKDLRMWVARCPRCAFAVRWTPRTAREPARAWSRLRALNLRLGVALGCAQLAAVLLLASGGLLENSIRSGARFAELDEATRALGPALVAGVCTGVLAGASAANAAPFRTAAATLAATWCAIVAMATPVWLLALVTESGGIYAWGEARAVFRRLAVSPAATATLVATMLVVSVVATLVLRGAIGFGARVAVRRVTRARRQVIAVSVHGLGARAASGAIR